MYFSRPELFCFFAYFLFAADLWHLGGCTDAMLLLLLLLFLVAFAVVLLLLLLLSPLLLLLLLLLFFSSSTASGVVGALAVSGRLLLSVICFINGNFDNTCPSSNRLLVLWLLLLLVVFGAIDG